MEFNSVHIQTRGGIETAGGPASRPMTSTRLQASHEPAADPPLDVIEIRLVCAEPTVDEMAELARLQLAMGNGQTIARAERRKSLTNLPAQKAA